MGLMDDLEHVLRGGLTGDPHPAYPGAVLVLDTPAGRERLVVGETRRYADTAGTVLPAEQRFTVTADTVYDLASISKLFTATVVLDLVADGWLRPDQPVADILQGYRQPGRDTVTLRHLLTHTSGLPAERFFWQLPGDIAVRRAAIEQTPLIAPPGNTFCYSCVGYLTLGLIAEAVSGQSLDQLVRGIVCTPLGLTRTGYQPLTWAGLSRDDVAATEVRTVSWTRLHDPADPDTRGVAHDENAASYDGVAGNAGLFGTADDLATFGRALLSGAGPYGRLRDLGILEPQLPTMINPGHQHALGWRLNDPMFMGALAAGHEARAYGHTGFTGTSIVVDAARDVVLVLLTNRVHPDRSWSAINPLRAELADRVAASHPPR